MSRKRKRKSLHQCSYQHRLQLFDYSLASLDFQCSDSKYDYGLAYQPIPGQQVDKNH